MSTSTQPLFRPESLKARQLEWVGRPAITLGLPTRVVTFTAVLLGAVAAALIIFGTYARRINLRGFVVPQSGLVKISAPTGGWIKSIHASDGQRVKDGAILYEVNVDTSTANGDTQQAIIRALDRDRATINQEIERRKSIRDAERANLLQKIENLGAQIAQTGIQVDTQTDFEQKLRAEFDRVSGLASRGITTRNDLVLHQQSWMAARSRLEELKSAQIRLQAELIDSKYKFETLDLQTGNELDRLKRNISQIDQQIATSEAHHSIQIRAPAAGTVTAVIGRPGQLVAAGGPMLTIVPQDSPMQAQLLAASSAIGFIHSGQRVLLRYSGFPYQKFGQYWGTVIDVSHAALPKQELNLLLENTSPQETGTYYRVTVQPDSQFVNVYGNYEPVPASMTVEALVLLDQRPLYEWILEPLYGLRRNFQTQ